MPRSASTPSRLTTNQRDLVNQHVKEKVMEISGPMPTFDQLLTLDSDLYGSYTRRPGIGRWSWDYLAPDGGRVITIGLQHRLDKVKDQRMIGRYYAMIKHGENSKARLRYISPALEQFQITEILAFKSGLEIGMLGGKAHLPVPGHTRSMRDVSESSTARSTPYSSPAHHAGNPARLTQPIVSSRRSQPIASGSHSVIPIDFDDFSDSGSDNSGDGADSDVVVVESKKFDIYLFVENDTKPIDFTVMRKVDAPFRLADYRVHLELFDSKLSDRLHIYQKGKWVSCVAGEFVLDRDIPPSLICRLPGVFSTPGLELLVDRSN